MSITPQDFDTSPYAEVATLQAPDSAYDHPSSVVQGALAMVNSGTETAATLGKLIDLRGRQSENAGVCRTLVNDYLIGLAELREVLNLVENGNQAAVRRIPAIVAGIQESFDFGTVLSKIKAYSNRKDGTRALPAYVQEVCTTLSGSFYCVFNSVSPLSEVLGVQTQVRDSVSAVGNYKFHGTTASVAKAEVARAPEILDFTPAEKAWFESKAPEHYEEVISTPIVKEKAVKEARGGFFSSIMGTLGSLASSVSRRVLPRAAIAGLALSLGGCVAPQDETGIAVSLPAPSRPLPVLIAPVAPAPVADWEVSDTSNIWKAVDSAVGDKCPALTKTQRVKEVGPMVHAALVAQTAGLTQVINSQQTADTDGEWLGKVSADEVKYGNTIPTDYPGVKASTTSTRIAGAHGLDGMTVEAYARTGLPDYNSYTCPTY